MRRLGVPAVVTVVAVSLGAPAAAGPAAPAATTWKLVQTTNCSAPRRTVGLACYDPAGSTFTDKWQIGDSSATLTVPAGS